MYEASNIVELGAAHNLILGVKPVAMTPDSQGAAHRDEEIDDIEEVED